MHKYCFSVNWRFADTWNMTNERTNECLKRRAISFTSIVWTCAAWYFVRWIHVLFTQLLNANDVYRRWVLVLFFQLRLVIDKIVNVNGCMNFPIFTILCKHFNARNHFWMSKMKRYFLISNDWWRFLMKNIEWSEKWAHRHTHTHTNRHKTKIFDQKFIITSME